ncbi:MAG: hypothetical protein WBY53_00200 [Acidobacteriaceae bacterium]
MADAVVEHTEDEVDYGRFFPVGEGGWVAADGGADDGEDARADDGADSESGEGDGAKGFLERCLGCFGLEDELVDGLCSKDLSGQGSILVNRDALD